MKMLLNFLLENSHFFPKKMKKKCVYVYIQKCAGFYYIIYKGN